MSAATCSAVNVCKSISDIQSINTFKKENGLRATIQGLSSYSHQGSADSGNPDFCFQIPLQRALCTVLNSSSTGGDGQAGATAPSKPQPQVPAVAWPIWQLPGNLPTEDHLFPDHLLSTLVPVKNNQCPMCNTRDTDYYVGNRGTTDVWYSTGKDNHDFAITLNGV